MFRIVVVCNGNSSSFGRKMISIVLKFISARNYGDVTNLKIYINWIFIFSVRI